MIDQFRDQDIYIDVHPYEETAVWLGDQQNEENYINACLIQSPYQEGKENCLMIATQGPLNNTVESFWRMILQERVGMVVTLCHEIGEFQTEWLPQ